MTDNYPNGTSGSVEAIILDETPPEPRRIHPRTLSWYGMLAGAGMIALALLWAHVTGGPAFRDWFPARRWLLDVLFGCVAGLVFALAAWRLIDRVPALKQIERIIMDTLDMEALRPAHTLWFGLIAGIPEEILFRGALQPVLGLVGASLIFGALHAITLAYFLYALVAGLILGGVAWLTGGLWTPVAAHIVIDVVMFVLLLARWRHYNLPELRESK